MKVAILGCGPAGLLSAWACRERGHKVTIASVKAKSKIPGAVFLHEPIPGLTAPEPDGMVEFHKMGTQQGYARKVYGDASAPCSWSQFDVGERPAWSMFDLYEQLWREFDQDIMDLKVVPRDVGYAVKWYDLVISTIPLNCICKDEEHYFKSQTIYVIDKSFYPQMHNDIIYNGSNIDFWYRTSSIFGSESTEATIPFPNWCVANLDAKVSIGYKPTETNCDCWPQVLKVGRFGRWRKGILVHHAYEQTVQLLEET